MMTQETYKGQLYFYRRYFVWDNVKERYYIVIADTKEIAISSIQQWCKADGENIEADDLDFSLGGDWIRNGDQDSVIICKDSGEVVECMGQKID